MGKYNKIRNRKKDVVIVLSPHPDDLELSASLMCLKLKTKYIIVEIILTDGSMGGINSKVFGSHRHIEKRKREAELSAQILGINKVVFLNYKDGQLLNEIEQAKKEVLEIVSIYNAKILCFPSSFDEHKDHVATNLIGKFIMQKMNEIIDLQYCFWGKNSNSNIKILLKKSSHLKKKAIFQHTSQPINKYLLNRTKILKEENFYSERSFHL